MRRIKRLISAKGAVTIVSVHLRAQPDGFDSKLTSSKWAKIAKCPPDTALRDIDGLIAQGILKMLRVEEARAIR